MIFRALEAIETTLPAQTGKPDHLAFSFLFAEHA